MKRPKIKAVEDIDFTQLTKAVEKYVEDLYQGEDEDAIARSVVEVLTSTYYGRYYWYWQDYL